MSVTILAPFAIVKHVLIGNLKEYSTCLYWGSGGVCVYGLVCFVFSFYELLGGVLLVFVINYGNSAFKGILDVYTKLRNTHHFHLKQKHADNEKVRI